MQRQAVERHLDLGEHELGLVSSPAALDPDGCTLGLQEVHPDRVGPEGCLKAYNMLPSLQVGSALPSAPYNSL